MNRQILSLAIPNVISNITVPFVGIVDIALVSTMGSVAFIGGVGFGAMVFTLLYTGLAFLRMGTTGLSAQAYGAANYRECAAILIRGLIFSFAAAILLIVMQIPISKILISNIDGSADALQYAAQYFKTRIYAAPATLSVFVFMGWFIGMQNSKIPMIITIIISLSNIIISSLLVIYADMKIEGVALGTVISQYIGLALCIYYFLKKYKRVAYFFSYRYLLQIVPLKKFFSVSRDIFIRSVLLTGSFFLFNALSAKMGDNILAVNSVMLQFLWFFAYIIDGFSYAGGTLSGRFVGAKDAKRLKQAISQTVKFGLGIAAIITVVYIVGTIPIFSILTKDKDVLALADNYKYWVWIIPFASFAAFLYDGIYVGATATKAMRNIMLLTILLLFLPCLFILMHFFGNHGMWLALIIMLAARGIGLRMFLKNAVYDKILD